MCKAFYYKNYAFDEKTGELDLNYAVNLADKEFVFTEKIVFPEAPFQLSTAQKQSLESIFFLTHIAFGISYYKAFCPNEIIIESGTLSQDEALFFNRFYESGLGEFAVRNNLNLQGKISFPYGTKQYTQNNLSFKNRYLIPVGGGKDSCLTIEVLKQTGQDCRAISIGNPRPIRECIETSALNSFTLKRFISPLLIELNKQGVVLNGHVPITGMLAFLLWASGVIYNYRYVALSCERSANSGNLLQGTLEINHQYSKSFEFEENFYALTQRITPDFRYFSLLRPLSELAIARLFSQECQAYFPVFTSCNKAFKLDESKRIDRWCGTCDKCRFVFLILAPFIQKEVLIDCVGSNPLNDPLQENGYKELLGLSGHKPFECVGEIDESRYAFFVLANMPEWQNDYIIQKLKNDVQKSLSNRTTQALFEPFDTHLIPTDIAECVLNKFGKKVKK